MKNNRYSKNPSVSWYIPSKNKPIAYSTTAIKDSIEVLSEGNKSVDTLLREFKNGTWIYNKEIIDILEKYIEKGFGSISLGRG